MRLPATTRALRVALIGSLGLLTSGCAWFGGRSDSQPLTASPAPAEAPVPVLRLGAADDMGWALLQQEHQRLAWATTLPSREPTRTATVQNSTDD